MTLHVLLASVLTAFAEESEPQDILINDNITVIQSTQLDSGWQPSSGNIQIRLAVTVDQDAMVNMQGTSTLGWENGSAMNMSLDGDAGMGEIQSNGVLSATIYGKFSLGNYSYEGELFTQDIPMTGSTTFTPFSLNTPITVESFSDGSEILGYDTTMFAVVDLSFAGEIHPNCSTTIKPKSWLVNGNLLTNDTDTVNFNPNGQSALETSATLSADVSALCSISLIPTFSIGAPVVGGTSLNITEINLQDINASFSHTFPLQEFHFPLPVLDTDSEIDFGTLAAGSSSNYELFVSNAGEMDLQSTVTLIDDSGKFQLFGSGATIPSGDSDSLVIAFNGADSGSFAATLEITSNDPNSPVIQIPISANIEGSNPDDGSDTGDSNVDDTSNDATKDGCATVSGSAFWMLALLPAALMRRRSR